MTWRSAAAAGAVLGLCGGVVALGATLEPPTRTAAADGATREFLRTAVRSCPGQVSADDAATVTAASVPETRGQDVPGRVEILDERRTLSAVTKTGATASSGDASPGRTPRVIASGGLAPGLLTAHVVADHQQVLWRESQLLWQVASSSSDCLVNRGFSISISLASIGGSCSRFTR